MSIGAPSRGPRVIETEDVVSLAQGGRQQGDDAVGCLGFIFVLAAVVALITWLAQDDHLNWSLLVLGWLAFFVYLSYLWPRRGEGFAARPFLVVPPVALGLIISTVFTAYDILNTPFYAIFLLLSFGGMIWWILRGPRITFPWGIPDVFGFSVVSVLLVGLATGLAGVIETSQERTARNEEATARLDVAERLIYSNRFDAAQRRVKEAREADPEDRLIRRRTTQLEDITDIGLEIERALGERDYRTAYAVAGQAPSYFGDQQAVRITRRIVNSARSSLFMGPSKKRLLQMVIDLESASKNTPRSELTLKARAEVTLSRAKRRLNRQMNPLPVLPAPGELGGGSGDFDLPGDIPGDVPGIPGI